MEGQRVIVEAILVCPPGFRSSPIRNFKMLEQVFQNIKKNLSRKNFTVISRI
jgi:hypothetical protein